MGASIKRLIKATAFTGASTILNTIIGFVKTKALALILGASGVGFIGQLNSFFLLMSNFTSLGNNVGVTRFVANYDAQGEKDKVARLLYTIRLAIGGFVLVCVVVGIIFSRQISLWILKDERYYLYIIITMIGLPFAVLYNFYRSFFTGLLEIRYYVVSGVLSALAGLIMVLPLIYFFQLNGAVWHIAFFSMASLSVASLFLRKIRRKRLADVQPQRRMDKAILKDILKFGAASLTAGTCLYAANLLARNIILGHLDFAAAGIYTAMLQISNQCIMLVLDSISAYCYPRLSGLQNQSDIVVELNQTMRLTLTLITPIIVLFMVFKDWIIVLFLSREFLLASSLIGIQLLGDACKAVGWSIGVSLLPLKKLKAFTIIDVLWSLIFVAGCYFSVPHWGLRGVLFSYLTAFLFHICANYLYTRNTIGYALTVANQRFLAITACLIVYATIVYTGSFMHFVLLTLLTMLWLRMAVRNSEISALLKTVKNKFTSNPAS
jgi:enterobacterial common antigen flippase